MYSFDICSFSYGVISHQTWGRVFSIGIFSLSSLLWGVISSLEPFGLFHLTGCLHMNIKTRQSPLFLPYGVVSDILAFSTEHFLFVFGLSSLCLVGGRGCGRGVPLWTWFNNVSQAVCNPTSSVISRPAFVPHGSSIS